jgi:hypothetical protein
MIKQIRWVLLGLALLLPLAMPGLTTARNQPRVEEPGPVLLAEPEVHNALQVGKYPSIRTLSPTIRRDVTLTRGERGLGPTPAGDPTSGVVFDGLNNQAGLTPSDVNGDVGLNHFVQGVNAAGGTKLGFYTKTGTLLQELNMKSLWNKGPCRERAQGDPVIQYDAMADRWLFTQFAFSSTERGPRPPFFECIALSNTSDPLGAGKTYTFFVDDEWFPDFPKFGVWRDGYYMTVHLFDRRFNYKGQGVVAFDRQSMLNGAPPRGSSRDKFPAHYFFGPDDFGALPADVSGSNPPPPGSPNYMVISKDDGLGANQDRIDLLEFEVHWNRPKRSKVLLVDRLNTNPFKSVLCRGSATCIKQPNSPIDLDPLAGEIGVGNFMNYPLTYRNIGGTETLVMNHTVNVGENRAGIRWYEITDPGGTPSITQQDTFSLPTLNRWVGSISKNALDQIALGYSVSGGTRFPSVRYAGREASDPPSTMGPETSLLEGNGSQTASNRWGDYTSTQVDPVDDCTFWYTNQYYNQSRPYQWRTVIGSFKFPSC